MKTIFAVLNTAWLCLCLNFACAQQAVETGQQQPINTAQSNYRRITPYSEKLWRPLTQAFTGLPTARS